ncbi:Uncharacterized conserved protein [Phaffia rhodozyma]|uniref:Uncharacterized conserved protein n=1 Tax=Phaffia rhodozyma TaxID=264483 RepID=A0A0F7SRU9_PHARH|nr:Uncharacterized conserved protein [Phaffia rhodozyma]
MGLNSPVPVNLPEECRKAAKILGSFVDSSNNGLDKMIPRQVMEHAKGFAIFTVVKAGFLVSVRAGSGVVIARLSDGTWSAPTAIGTGGVGLGGQAGAEVTDFLIVLNSRAAVNSFMAAGSLNIGGNMSLAVGPLGRNAEGMGALNTKGKVAAMFTYSKTKGLFGGVSLEGSVIVERQDANRLAYGTNVTSKQLLSGMVPPPPWAQLLIEKLTTSTGLPGGRAWVEDSPRNYESNENFTARTHSPTWSEEFGDGTDRENRYDSPNDRRGSSPSSYAFGGMGSDGKESVKPSGALESKGRTRSRSILGSRGKNDTPAEQKADNAVTRSRADSTSSRKSNSNKTPTRPGLFSSMSSFSRKRGNSKSGLDSPGLTTSESYTQADQYFNGGPPSPSMVAKSLPFANSPSHSHPPPFLQRNPSSQSYIASPKPSTPQFAHRFDYDSEDESDRPYDDDSGYGGERDRTGRAGEEADGRRRGNSGSNGSINGPISWDNGPLSTSHTAVTRPSYLPSSLSSSYIHRQSTDSYTDDRHNLDASPSEEFNRRVWDAPIDDFRPTTTDGSSRTSRNVPPSFNRARSSSGGGNDLLNSYESRGIYSRPSNRDGPSMMEEDWGSLGQKARIGLGRTRSGSEAAVLAANNSFGGGLIPTLANLNLKDSSGGEDSLSNGASSARQVNKGAQEMDSLMKEYGAVGQAVAKFTFEGVESGDLPFRKGDIILILEMTQTKNDWWQGMIGSTKQKGSFPGSYVDVLPN